MTRLLLTVPEAAEALAISRSKLYELLASGAVASIRIDGNQITVTEYLDEWIDSHSMEIKPRTLLDYRACIRLYIAPRIGHMPIQAVRPSTITKLYRDLLAGGGRNGKPLAITTVIHL